MYFYNNFQEWVLIVEKLDDVHPIGTFKNINKIQDLGDWLRLIVIAHQRIKSLKIYKKVHGKWRLKFLK